MFVVIALMAVLVCLGSALRFIVLRRGLQTRAASEVNRSIEADIQGRVRRYAMLSSTSVGIEVPGKDSRNPSVPQTALQRLLRTFSKVRCPVAQTERDGLLILSPRCDKCQTLLQPIGCCGSDDSGDASQEDMAEMLRHGTNEYVVFLPCLHSLCFACTGDGAKRDASGPSPDAASGGPTNRTRNLREFAEETCTLCRAKADDVICATNVTP
jgi:hypothetical protein